MKSLGQMLARASQAIGHLTPEEHFLVAPHVRSSLRLLLPCQQSRLQAHQRLQMYVRFLREQRFGRGRPSHHNRRHSAAPMLDIEVHAKQALFLMSVCLRIGATRGETWQALKRGSNQAREVFESER